MSYRVGVEEHRFTAGTYESQHGAPAYAEHFSWVETTNHAVEESTTLALCGAAVDRVTAEEFTSQTPTPCGACLLRFSTRG